MGSVTGSSIALRWRMKRSGEGVTRAKVLSSHTPLYLHETQDNRRRVACWFRAWTTPALHHKRPGSPKARALPTTPLPGDRAQEPQDTRRAPMTERSNVRTRAEGWPLRLGDD